MQFKPADLRQLEEAQLLVICGLGMEPWLDASKASLGTKYPRVLETTRSFEGKLIRREAVLNPHFWLDPMLALHAASNIASAILDLAPAQSGRLLENVQAAELTLRQLDRDFAEAAIQWKGASVVTQHDAFAYMARRYGLDVAGVLERVPDMEPSPRELAALMAVIRAKNVQAIITEPQYPARLGRQLAADARIRWLQLDPIETGEVTPGSYETAMRGNLAALARLKKP